MPDFGALFSALQNIGGGIGRGIGAGLKKFGDLDLDELSMNGGGADMAHDMPTLSTDDELSRRAGSAGGAPPPRGDKPIPYQVWHRTKPQPETEKPIPYQVSHRTKPPEMGEEMATGPMPSTSPSPLEALGGGKPWNPKVQGVLQALGGQAPSPSTSPSPMGGGKPWNPKVEGILKTVGGTLGGGDQGGMLRADRLTRTIPRKPRPQAAGRVEGIASPTGATRPRRVGEEPNPMLMSGALSDSELGPETPSGLSEAELGPESPYEGLGNEELGPETPAEEVAEGEMSTRPRRALPEEPGPTQRKRVNNSFKDRLKQGATNALWGAISGLAHSNGDIGAGLGGGIAGGIGGAVNPVAGKNVLFETVDRPILDRAEARDEAKSARELETRGKTARIRREEQEYGNSQVENEYKMAQIRELERKAGLGDREAQARLENIEAQRDYRRKQTEVLGTEDKAISIPQGGTVYFPKSGKSISMEGGGKPLTPAEAAAERLRREGKSPTEVSIESQTRNPNGWRDLLTGPEKELIDWAEKQKDLSEEKRSQRDKIISEAKSKFSRYSDAHTNRNASNTDREIIEESKKKPRTLVIKKHESKLRWPGRN